MDVQALYLVVPLAPLLGAIIVGLFGPKLGRAASHWLCILGVTIAFVASIYIWRDVNGRPLVQRRRLHVDPVGQPQARDRFPDRPADRDDAAGGDVRVADGPHLHDRLHGRRRRLHPVLQLYLAVHVQHADARDEQQLPPAVLRLGGGGPGFVSPHRLLPHAGVRDLRQPQGVSRQPRRRFRLHPGDRPGAGLLRHARVCAGICQGRRACRRRRSISWAAPNGR